MDRKQYLREYHKKYYSIQENRDKRLEKERIASEVAAAAYREWKSTLSCSVCDEREPCCLEMHHKNPAEKEFSLGKRGKKRLIATLKEAEKCICLCSNCHKKVHAGLIDVSGIPNYSSIDYLASKTK